MIDLKAHQIISLLSLVVAAAFAPGCNSGGAPLKKASDVNPIFSDASVMSLDDKFRESCLYLNQQTQAPNLKNIDAAAACGSPAGKQAVNLSSVGSEVPYFALTDDSAGFSSIAGTQDQVQTIKTRAQIWLNIDALTFAKNAISSMDQGAENLLGSSGGSDDMQIEVIEKGEMDPKTNRLEMKARFKADGTSQGMTTKIDNLVKITTILYEERFIFISVETVQDEEWKNSLIKSFKMVTLLIPHAQDVYMDSMSEFKFHSFGADSAVKQFFGKTYGNVVKSLPDIFTTKANLTGPGGHHE